MIPDFSNAVILFGAGLALLLGLSQVLSPRRSIKSILLFVIFCSISVFQIQQLFTLVARGAYLNNELHALLMAEYMMGPSMYLFYLSLFYRGYSFSWKSLVHFIPAMVAFILILVLNIHHYITGRLLESLYHFIVMGEIPYYFHLMGIALIVGYILAILSRMEILSIIRSRNSMAIRDRMNKIALTVTLTLFFIIILTVISIFTRSGFFAQTAQALTSVFVIYWFVMSQIHPELFYAIPKKEKTTKKARELEQNESARIGKELDDLVEREKLYCDEDLSLQRLARLLSVSPQELSLFLNHELKMNFNSYINGYRVDEAIKIMEEDSDRSLLSIAFAVGFNSKSVFYDAFTRKTGVSPAKYRKNKIPAQKS